MGTKNLARSAIEGGRTNSNKWDRRYSHAEARAHEKAYISEVTQDIENWYDYDVEPLSPVYKQFNDKLGPMYRWLERHCGQPWADVRSKVSETFDTRTTAGRHIVYDHMLSQVDESVEVVRRYYSAPPDNDPTKSYSRHDFYVDDEGILRQKTYVRRRYRSYYKSSYDTNKLAGWLNGRVVGFVGDKAYWFVPVGKNKKHRMGTTNRKWITQWGWGKNRPYYYYNQTPLRFLYLREEPIYKKDAEGVKIVDEHGKGTVIDFEYVWTDGSPSFRQDRKLNDQECAFWNTIPDEYRWIVLEHSPTYVAPKDAKKPTYYY